MKLERSTYQGARWMVRALDNEGYWRTVYLGSYKQCLGYWKTNNPYKTA